MARQPRFFVPDVPLHVIQRGNNRQPVFLDPDDRNAYLECLLYAIKRHGVDLHAFVLMTNHVHLLGTPRDPCSMPKAMQAVGRVFVRHFNEKHGRTGTLWEGRYRATAVETERYLLACMRYIEFNPVRAGLVATPREYAWSSFAANAAGRCDQLITPHPVYLQLGSSQGERARAYAAVLDVAPKDDETRAIREATHKGWALGGDEFCDRIHARTLRRSRPLHAGRTKGALTASKGGGDSAGGPAKLESDPNSRNGSLTLIDLI
jgi:putative transposase